MALERLVYNVPTQQEFDAAIAGLKQAITDAGTRVVTDLQGKLAAGDPITAADLQSIVDATTAAAAIDPAPAPAPPGTKP